jgi:hypothetical protein
MKNRWMDDGWMESFRTKHLTFNVFVSVHKVECGGEGETTLFMYKVYISKTHVHRNFIIPMHACSN